MVMEECGAPLSHHQPKISYISTPGNEKTYKVHESEQQEGIKRS